MENQLQIIVRESGLESTKAQAILTQFQNYFEIAAEWEARAQTILVTDATQKAEMALARTGRLFLRDKRIAIEKSRKELKEQALREGKAIDGIANVLKGLIEPIEAYLDQQEHFVELKAKAELAERQREIERRMEEERIAREKAEAEERERIRLENERLRREREELERKAEDERKEQARILAAEREKAEAERKAIEEKARKEREERERVIAEERHKEEIERQRLQNEARREREKAEERERASIAAAREREEEERKAREELERKLAAQVTCPYCGKMFMPNHERIA